MAVKKVFGPAEFNSFEKDLLSVLKNDPEHKIDFDGKLLFKSRRYDCLLAATDVHWDEKTGDIVLVGAFRSGQPVMDETKKYPVFKTRISVPLKECFEDLKVTSGNEMKLVGKAKKAVLVKYLEPQAKRYQARGMFKNGIMDLKSFECGNFRLSDSDVIGLTVGEEGRFNLICANSFSDAFRVDSGNVTLREMQEFCRQLDRINTKLTEACDVYASALKAVRPNSTSETEHDTLMHYSAALVDVYKKGFPLRIVDVVARSMANMDVFDPDLHSRREMEAMVKDFERTGILRHVPKKNNGPSF